VATALAVVGLAAVLAACGDVGGRQAGAGSSRLSVVTTVAPITSIVSSVVGTAADVRGLVPEGADSHTFEPPPSAARALSRADLVFVNGLKLEDPTRELAQANLKKGADVVELGTQVLPPEQYVYDFSFPKEGGKPNPHLWTDPIYAKKYAEVIRDALVKADPKNRSVYERNAAAFGARVDELDAAMRTAFATMTPEQRKLLTYHDAYAYFAKDYGWDVVGAIQVGSFDDPTPREVAALIQQVKAEKVPAIFGSEVFPSPVLAQIGKEAAVKYVDVLRDDDLPGKPGDPEHSWLGLMRFDYLTMVESLGGDASALRAVVVDNGVPDHARYPQ
jgi:ABC-type Zn uptake system ZnuABC Zn-binding protein ZnuA